MDRAEEEKGTAAGEMTGHPVQFITRDKDQQTLRFNLSDIQVILDKVGERPLAIVSVNGDERTGKSTLLNLFLNYLPPDQRNLPLPADLPGFECKAGLQPTSFGMAFWSEPFFVRQVDNREIAVLLLDIQGTGQQSQSSIDRANQEIMFCLSMWLSSVFICNVQGRYIADPFQLPESFTDLAAMFGQEEFIIEPPLFQNLLVLFRDWHLFADHAYGVRRAAAPRARQDARQSDATIMKELRAKSVIGKLMETIRRLSAVDKLFSDISAFLLPFPGSEIASNYNGQFNVDESSTFLLYIQKLVNFLFRGLSPHVKPKLSYGKEMTGTDLKALMARWDQLFTLHNGAPNVRAIGGVVVDHHLDAVSQSVQDKYDATMTEVAKKGLEAKEFYMAHAQCRRDCLDSFEAASKNVSKFQDKLPNAVHQLSYYLDSQFIVYRKSNQSQQVNQLRKKVAFLTEELVKVSQLQEKQEQEIRAKSTTIRQLVEDKVYLEKTNQLRIGIIEKYQCQLGSLGVQTPSYDDVGIDHCVTGEDE